MVGYSCVLRRGPHTRSQWLGARPVWIENPLLRFSALGYTSPLYFWHEGVDLRIRWLNVTLFSAFVNCLSHDFTMFSLVCDPP